MRDWNPVKVACHDWKDLVSAYSSEGFWLVEIDAHHIYQDGIDRKLAACGLKTRLIIVASKHKSKDGNRVLTAHYTGNSGNADFGGHSKGIFLPCTFCLEVHLAQHAKRGY